MDIKQKIQELEAIAYSNTDSAEYYSGFLIDYAHQYELLIEPLVWEASNFAILKDQDAADLCFENIIDLTTRIAACYIQPATEIEAYEMCQLIKLYCVSEIEALADICKCYYGTDIMGNVSIALIQWTEMLQLENNNFEWDDIDEEDDQY